MAKELFFALLLIYGFCPKTHCEIHPEKDIAKRNCSFVLSNGDYEEFLTAIPLFENCTKQFGQNAILFIKLINYNLPAFPNGTFTNLPRLKSFTLKIFNGTQVQLLSPLLPTYSVFENLTFEDAIIDVSNSTTLIGWNWTALSEIRHRSSKVTDNLQVVVSSSKLVRLDPSFGKIAGGGITVVRIINCHLRWLGKDVFGPLSKLKGLELRKNLLEKFERSHLPTDASKLRFLDLGKNRLKYISENLFDGLLSLQQLFLDGNNMKLLGSQVDGILAVETLYYISGGLWPCECEKLKRMRTRIAHFEKGLCYNDLSNKTIATFLSTCGI